MTATFIGLGYSFKLLDGVSLLSSLVIRTLFVPYYFGNTVGIFFKPTSIT